MFFFDQTRILGQLLPDKAPPEPAPELQPLEPLAGRVLAILAPVTDDVAPPPANAGPGGSSDGPSATPEPAAPPAAPAPAPAPLPPAELLPPVPGDPPPAALPDPVTAAAPPPAGVGPGGSAPAPAAPLAVNRGALVAGAAVALVALGVFVWALARPRRRAAA